LFAVVRTGQGRREQAAYLHRVHGQGCRKDRSRTVTITEVKSTDLTRTPVWGCTPTSLSITRMCTRISGARSQRRNQGQLFRQLLSILHQPPPFIGDFRLLDFHDAADAERRQQGPGFGQEPRALHSTQQKKVTFKDVAGVEEAKEELQEIIEFLRGTARSSRSWADAFPRAFC